MNGDLIALLEELYFDQDLAHMALIKIGYPGVLPAFRAADVFWPWVLRTLDSKVTGGTIALLKATRVTYPGRSAEVDRLLALAAAEMGGVEVVQVEPEMGPPMQRVLPGDGKKSSHGSSPPPPPPTFGEESEVARAGKDCPTLTLEGADLAEEFLAVARDMFGTAELLYIADRQSAVRIPDPGDQDEAVRRSIQNQMRTRAPSCLVMYRKYPFQPYLYAQLEVCGPDTSKYKMESVPATSTPEDIAAAIVAETYEVNSGAKGKLIRAVVDHESAHTGRRLDPYTSLHECGVQDGDRLRVAPEAIAGSLSPEKRMDALLRAVGQIRGYAARNPSTFAIVDYDDEELPGRMTVQIAGNGLAPPAGLDRFPDRSDWVDLDDFTPVVIKLHRIAIHFSAMFPLAAPEIIWESPVFHPNVEWISEGGICAGRLFQPSVLGFRPEHNLARLSRMVTDVAMYRDYDLTEEASSPNPLAALWAATDPGQTMIKAIGGRPLPDVMQEKDRRSRPPRLFRLKPLRDEPNGH